MNIMGSNKLIIGVNDFATKNPKLVKEWHPIRNGDVTPNSVASGTMKKFWWQCKFGHEWEASPNKRSAGRGCPECSKKTRVKVKIENMIKQDGSLLNNNPELANEWHPTKNGNLTSDMVTLNSNQKVWWLGKCGHEWEARIAGRNKKGSGCPVCANLQIVVGFNDLATLMPELAKEWHPTKNGDITPTMISVKAQGKAWWICDKGHEWEAYISHRSNGIGCPTCKKSWQTSLPEQIIFYYMKKAFPSTENSYKFLKNNEIDIYINEFNLGIEYDGEAWHKNPDKDIKKNLLCKKHNINLIRIRENKCPKLNDDTYCVILENSTMQALAKAIQEIFHYISKNHVKLNHKINIDIERDLQAINNQYIETQKENNLLTINPELAKEWHPTLNENLKPDMVTYGSKLKVWWLGKCGHEWDSIIHTRSKGVGCPYCSNKKVLKGYNDLATTNPKLSEEWHPTLNKDITPFAVHIGSHDKIWWLGQCGHEWQSEIRSRKNSDCPFCLDKGAKVLKGYNDLATTNVELAKEWHPTKNGVLTPDMVLSGSGKRVWWICNNSHEWEAIIRERNNGTGCPFCRKMKRIKRL